jgi:hypothetical protein
MAGENREVVRKIHSDYVQWLREIGTPDQRLAPRLEL